MGILVTFVCDYAECGEHSEQVPADYIDTYSYHDAPGDGVTACEPPGWLHDILYYWVACPAHRAEMLADRAKYDHAAILGPPRSKR